MAESPSPSGSGCAQLLPLSHILTQQVFMCTNKCLSGRRAWPSSGPGLPLTQKLYQHLSRR